MHAIVLVQSQPQAVDDSSRAASVTTTSSYDDELAALVLDGGSMFFKAGFAGDAPRAVFPSVVTGSPIPNTAFIQSARNRFVGDEAIANQNCFYLEHPIQRGLITDWDQMEKVFYYNNSYYSTQLLYTFSDLASYFLQ